jgi:molybdopterin biosynthesis enzyme
LRLERLRPGTRPARRLVGVVLVRDLVVAGQRWSKGRRLSAADLDLVAGTAASDVSAPGIGRRVDELTVIALDAGDVHEDEAATRLAAAICGPGLEAGSPHESRVDLRATVPGLARVRVPALERLNRIDPLEAFTVFDRQVVRPGELVASVKIAPHVLPATILEAGERVAAAAWPIVRVAPFRRRRVAVVVKESIAGAARERFETSVRAKVEGLGSEVVGPLYVADTPDAVAEAIHSAVHGSHRADIILTAGAASTDPLDSVFVALEGLGGALVRQGVPAHPGSMLWLARVDRVPVLGLPTCGAFSKATAVDLLLPRLLAGESANATTLARLSHGGILSRDMRFRFPEYARELESPDG